MAILIIGLALFIGMHSIPSFAPAWREQKIASLGRARYRAIYSLLTLLALVLIVWGYGQTRIHPVDLWSPPLWTRHLASLFTLVAFVLIAAAYVPGNRLKAALMHPMVVGVKTWAFAHLISNGRLGDLLLFGGLLLWSAMIFPAARKRDRAAGVKAPAGSLQRDLLTVSVGVVGWAAFAFWLHGLLIGVRPFG